MYEATKQQDESLENWALRMLFASPGATVGSVEEVNGKKTLRVFQIPTLVPARKPDGSCVNLTEDGKCSIHTVSPFGCAFIDSHMTAEQASSRSMHGLKNLLAQLNDPDSAYYRLWVMLNEAGKNAPSAKESRQSMTSTETKKETS
jgi:hypothetical protein